jgi:hypothetical protein
MQRGTGKLKLLWTQYTDITESFCVILCLYAKNLTQAWALKLSVYLKNTGQRKFVLMKTMRGYRSKI